MSDFMYANPVTRALTRPPATRPPWLAGSCLLMLGLLGAPVAQAAIQTYTIDPATGHVGGSPDKLVGRCPSTPPPARS